MNRRKWQLVYYEVSEKDIPVKDFIDRLDEREQGKVFAWIKQLAEHGPNLPRPYADYLRDDIHELRIKISGNNERIIYVLAHYLPKHTKKVPDEDIELARQRKVAFLQRYKTKEALIQELRKRGCLCVV